MGTPTNRQAPQVQPGGGERPTSMYSGDSRGAYSPSAPRYAQGNTCEKEIECLSVCLY